MLTMIETLLDLNKLEQGELKLDQERTRLQQLIEITWQAMEDHFRAKGLEGNIKLPDEQLIIRVDLSRVLKVLHHLLENALNFTEYGKIEVEAKVQQDETGQPELLLVISDTGCGISQDKLIGIFDRFSHARQYRQYDIASGGGLGLNYAKVVINAHDGKIWAESPGCLGSGTSFYITLPLH
jgi:signal transduction histidine kinase